FLDSIAFAGTNGLPEQPLQPTWPLGVMDQLDMTDQNFNPDPVHCPGQVDPNIPDAVWAAIQARDPIGPGWGPQPGGLSRYPIVSRFGWTPTVDSNIRIPALVF